MRAHLRYKDYDTSVMNALVSPLCKAPGSVTCFKSSRGFSLGSGSCYCDVHYSALSTSYSNAILIGILDVSSELRGISILRPPTLFA